MSPTDHEDRDRDNYTADEMRHVVSREVMKYRMADVEANVKRNAEIADGMFGKIFTKIDESLVEIKALMRQSSADVEKCRDELRREASGLYATRAEMEGLRGEISLLSNKIIWATSTVVVLAQIVGYFLK